MNFSTVVVVVTLQTTSYSPKYTSGLSSDCWNTPLSTVTNLTLPFTSCVNWASYLFPYEVSDF